MLSNRSIPSAIVIPVLAYPDVNQAAAWLCNAFGFSVRLRIGSHRVQLNVGEGAVILREMRPNEANERLGEGRPLQAGKSSRCADHARPSYSSIRRAAVQRRGLRGTFVDVFAVGGRCTSRGVGRDCRAPVVLPLSLCAYHCDLSDLGNDASCRSCP
jgi:hypothetical protein